MNLKCLFGHQWNGCKCDKCGSTRNEQHHWDGNKCVVCGKTKGGFYIFIAMGSSVFSMSRGAIVHSVKNENLWYNNLIKANPFSDKMEVITINDDCWNHPDPGLIIKGENIDLNPYIDAIKKHLIEKMTLTSQQAEKAISLFKSNNIGTVDYFDGRLAFGVPVE